MKFIKEYIVLILLMAPLFFMFLAVLINNGEMFLYSMFAFFLNMPVITIVDDLVNK